MRIHSFLEHWGLINFNVEPYLKPHKISVIKEASYNKVLINAANKYYLCKISLIFNNIIAKNEEEYLNNLFDVEQPSSKATIKAMIDQTCLKKINILTSKDRPFCVFCNALCGFSWY